jgi:hypothetical protein
MPLYKPAPGLSVRDPRDPRAHIEASGVEVGPNDFELQRLVDVGDLVPVAAPPVTAQETVEADPAAAETAPAQEH